MFLRSRSFLVRLRSQDGPHTSDVATNLLQLTVVGQLLGRELHAQAELRLQQVRQLLIESGLVFLVKFGSLHHCSLGAELARNEVRLQRQLSCSQTERFTCQLFSNTVHFIQHLARLNLCDVVLRVTFTVTHPHFSRLLRDRLVRENADPALSDTVYFVHDCTAPPLR